MTKVRKRHNAEFKSKISVEAIKHWVLSCHLDKMTVNIKTRNSVLSMDYVFFCAYYKAVININSIWACNSGSCRNTDSIT